MLPLVPHKPWKRLSGVRFSWTITTMCWICAGAEEPGDEAVPPPPQPFRLASKPAAQRSKLHQTLSFSRVIVLGSLRCYEPQSRLDVALVELDVQVLSGCARRWRTNFLGSKGQLVPCAGANESSLVGSYSYTISSQGREDNLSQ